METFEKRFGCQIRIHRQGWYGCEPEKAHFWTGFKFELYQKYRQYFRYRAALLQVKYPHRYVEIREFDYDYVPSIDEKTKRLKDLIKGNKGKLTKQLNLNEAYKAKWNSLFSIEDDEMYNKMLDRVLFFQNKVNDLEYQLKTMNHGNKDTDKGTMDEGN